MGKRQRRKAVKGKRQGGPTRSKPGRPAAGTRKKRPASRGGGAGGRGRRSAPPRRRGRSVLVNGAHVTEALEMRIAHLDSSPVLSGGDVDADWERAASVGEEGVGGSVATPDQDVVDEIGRALGVEQPLDAPLRPTQEILDERDRRHWELERRAERRTPDR